MKKNQIEEVGSRSLMRLMIFSAWLSFVASTWLFTFCSNLKFGLFAGLWLIIVLFLAGILSTKQK